MLSGPGAGGRQIPPRRCCSMLYPSPTARAPASCNSAPATVRWHLLQRRSESAFFIRVRVEDRAGVLAQLASVFGHQNVSIHSMIQKGHRGPSGPILITHPTAERAFRASMREVEGLSAVRGRPRTLMVL